MEAMLTIRRWSQHLLAAARNSNEGRKGEACLHICKKGRENSVFPPLFLDGLTETTESDKKGGEDGGSSSLWPCRGQLPGRKLSQLLIPMTELPMAALQSANTITVIHQALLLAWALVSKPRIPSSPLRPSSRIEPSARLEMLKQWSLSQSHPLGRRGEEKNERAKAVIQPSLLGWTWGGETWP
jgi:hypothetical protein